MKFGKLETVYSSAPQEYELLTLEVLLDGEPVARIDQEEGIDRLNIELFGTSEKFQAKIPLNDLVAALKDAQQNFSEGLSKKDGFKI
ncbi:MULTISPECIES: hypothetical protein [Variovorax]|uniref:hypothetical protein n=1 Tax=Variovorax TaxID=34072 RepID=UPI002859C951|nr:hypothetical protein [Variovorax sp. 3319]MDR6891027.1 hypothetical protein [Variovorax sp. 3319]